MFSSKKQEKGQGLVEYALILVLVAVVVLAVLLILGPIVGNVFSNVNSGLTVDSGNGGGEAAAVGLGCPDIHADGYATGPGYPYQCYSPSLPGGYNIP